MRKYLEKLKLILLRPREFFSSVDFGTNPLEVLIAFVITSGTVRLASALIFGASSFWTFGVNFLLLLVGIIGDVLKLAFSSIVAHGVGRVFLKVKGQYLNTLGVFLYVGVVSNLTVFVFWLASLAFGQRELLGIASIAVAMYLIYINIVGLSIAHRISLSKAVVMYFVPGLIMLVATYFRPSNSVVATILPR